MMDDEDVEVPQAPDQARADAALAVEFGEVEAYFDVDEVKSRRRDWNASADSWSAERDDAVAAYLAGDQASMRMHLKTMKQVEEQWGDWPATQDVEDLLLHSKGPTTAARRAQKQRQAQSAAVATYEARAKKAFAAREARLVAEHQAALKQAGAGAVASFCRALRIAAARQASNLEASPLRITAENLIGAPRSLGVDAQGTSLEYGGADPELARYIAAEIMVHSGAYLDGLMNRASELMGRGDQYLLDAEADARNFQAALPPITAGALTQLDEVSARAALTRQALAHGNFVVAPLPSPEGAAGISQQRAAIRGVMQGTAAAGMLRDVWQN
jgi:hypothetical protein